MNIFPMKKPNETAGAAALAPIQNIKVADIVSDPMNQARAVEKLAGAARAKAARKGGRT